MILNTAGVAGVPSLSKFRGIKKSLQETHGVRQHKIVNSEQPTLRTTAMNESATVEGRESSESPDIAKKYPLHINDPRDVIALHWANPQVRPHIQIYPTYRRSDGPAHSKAIKEMWDGQKFEDLPSNALPPMFENSLSKKHFYVGELATEGPGGKAWIPLRWMRVAGSNCFVTEAAPVQFDDDGRV